MNEDLLCVSAQRALLYNLSPKFRVISIDYPTGDILDMMIVISQNLTSDEKQLAYDFCGEITGDFVELRDVNIKFVEFAGCINNAPKLSIVLHALYK